MAQWLRALALAVLPEDSDLIPSTRKRAHNLLCVTPVPGYLKLSSGSIGKEVHIKGTWIYIQAINILLWKNVN